MIKNKIFYAAIILVSLSALGEEVEQHSKLSNESEVSLIQTGGNSNVETYNGKTLTAYELSKSVYSLSGHYTVAFYKTVDDSGNSVKAESARNWDARGKYERVVNPRFNIFGALQYEGNKFSGYKQRENIDIGGKYFLFKSEKMSTSFELGARHTVEMNVNRDQNNEDKFSLAKGRLFLEHDQVVSEALSFTFWVEFIPNFTNGEDYLVNFEPSASVVLTKIFSLKSAYKVVYDNVPNIEGNKKKDFKFTTSLLARF